MSIMSSCCLRERITGGKLALVLTGICWRVVSQEVQVFDRRLHFLQEVIHEVTVRLRGGEKDVESGQVTRFEGTPHQRAGRDG